MADESGNERHAIVARERAEFSHFLAWLAPDCECGAKRYELLRQKLIMFFECRRCRCSQELRGVFCPEDLCDRAIQRAVGRVARGVESPPEKRVAFVLGIAGNIWKEWLREHHEPLEDPGTIEQKGDGKGAEAPPEDAEKERWLDALDACLQELPADERELILKYYAPGNRNRGHEAIREETDTKPETLRSRIHRIKKRLRECMQQKMTGEARG